MGKDVKIQMTTDEALTLYKSLGEFIHQGQRNDAEGFEDKNLAQASEIQKQIIWQLRPQALAALGDILINTDEVTMGNGVNDEGQMYDDVEEGLKLAKAILEQL